VSSQTVDLKSWRRSRLGQAKRTPEYQSLPKRLRQVVDYMVRAHESPEGGIFVSQTKLAKRFGVTRQTMNEYLGAIARAGVLTTEWRSRQGVGAGRGRTTNRYRLNQSLLFSELRTKADIGHDIEPDSGSTSYEVHVEVPSGHVEALLTVEQEEDANEEVETRNTSPFANDDSLRVGQKTDQTTGASSSTFASDVPVVSPKKIPTFHSFEKGEYCLNCERSLDDSSLQCAWCSDHPRKQAAVAAAVVRQRIANEEWEAKQAEYERIWQEEKRPRAAEEPMEKPALQW
jgi:hypothetical protein